MEKMLLIRVNLLDNRYHGAGDWPPAPARLFQALIAGNAVGAILPPDCMTALGWLEAIPRPPEIFAPGVRGGRRFTTFVPNNDLDAKAGDLSRVADIRVGKLVRPRFILSDAPIIYLWYFENSGESAVQASSLSAMAANLYQFGRGIDMARASALVVDRVEADTFLDNLSGTVYRPGTGGLGLALDCPQPGSLASLLERYQAHHSRFVSVCEGRKTQVYFAQPPKPRFRRVVYNAPNRWRLYELRTSTERNPFRSWPQRRVVQLVEKVRDKAVARLGNALPENRALIERVIVGRGAMEADKAARIRLIPIPSLGHALTNRSVRRLLVDVPPDCPLRFEDIAWALSGLLVDSREDQATGEIVETLLTSAEDLSMLRHYGIESGALSRVWRTVTPAVLSEQAARRRINPRRIREEAKGGSERAREEARARFAVAQALRHAGVKAPVESIAVQREPFSGRGVRAEAFAAGTRFTKGRLWHVELTFSEPVEGPLLIGDGRYLGLGLLAPQQHAIGIHVFEIASGTDVALIPEDLTRALRRAVMSRIQCQIGDRKVLAGYFTGHELDGRTLRRGKHQHLAFAADLNRNRILIIAPHILERRRPTSRELEYLAALDLALRGFRELRVNGAGALRLHQTLLQGADDAVFGRSRRWVTVTAYRPTRHAKHLSPEDALLTDVYSDIRRRGWPKPKAEVVSVKEGPRGGLSGHLRLRFQVAQPGPILIGRSCHFGGGLFVIDSS